MNRASESLGPCLNTPARHSRHRDARGDFHELFPRRRPIPRDKSTKKQGYAAGFAHFIPTSSSWLNLVERWFGELTGKRLRRGVFVSVQDLVDAIHQYMAVWNQDPKPFVWTATVESIVEKLRGCRQTLE